MFKCLSKLTWLETTAHFHCGTKKNQTLSLTLIRFHDAFIWLRQLFCINVVFSVFVLFSGSGFPSLSVSSRHYCPFKIVFSVIVFFKACKRSEPSLTIHIHTCVCASHLNINTCSFTTSSVLESQGGLSSPPNKQIELRQQYFTYGRHCAVSFSVFRHLFSEWACAGITKDQWEFSFLTGWVISLSGTNVFIPKAETFKVTQVVKVKWLNQPHYFMATRAGQLFIPSCDWNIQEEILQSVICRSDASCHNRGTTCLHLRTGNFKLSKAVGTELFWVCVQVHMHSYTVHQRHTLCFRCIPWHKNFLWDW